MCALFRGMQTRTLFRHIGMLLALLACATPACISNPDTLVEDDPESAFTDNLTVASSAQRKLTLRVHIMRNISFTVQGVNMNNNHITASVVRNKLVPELNKIWAQANVLWNVESIVEENAIKPSNFAQMKSIVENAKRNDEGESDPARLAPLYAFMDPMHRSKTSELGANLFHIYIYPFIGNTSQGNAMRNFGFHTVVGSWSNKDNGGGVPTKRQSTENQSNCVKGSLGRTIAHELGHVLTLQHDQCSNCLMSSCGYSITSAQISDARAEAKARMQ